MTTTGYLIGLGAFSAGGAALVVLGEAAALDLPIKEVLSLGAAGVALTMCWLFLREQKEMRKEHNDALQQATQTFAKSSEKFAETSAAIHRECRESHERREAELHTLIRETRRGP